MATKYRVQHSFAAGELSQKLHGRFESELYKQGVKTLKNFVPLLQGPAKRRPGTYYAADAEQQAANGSRLVPFYFGDEQIYEKELAVSLYNDLVEFNDKDKIEEIKLIDSNPRNNPQPPKNKNYLMKYWQ